MKKLDRYIKDISNYEEVNCCVCEIKPNLWTHDWSGISISICPSCGLRFVSPRLKEKILEKEIYTSDYYNNKIVIQEKLDVNLNKGENYLLSSIENYKSPKSIFDVSAGNGKFLLSAQKRGWFISGSEISQEQSIHLSKLLNCKIYVGYIESLEIEERYDVVSFIHVIEHTANPVLFLKKCATFLKEDGVLYGIFPNTKSISDRFKTFLSKYGLKRKKYKHFSAQHHLWFFDLKTTKRVFEKAGLELISLKSMVKPENRTIKIIDYFIEKIGLGTWIEVVAKKRY